MYGSTREAGAQTVGEARAAVARWVRDVAVAGSGVEGACLAGSLAGLGEDAPLPPGSDVDVWLVLADGAYPSDRGERFVRVDGFFVDVAYVPGAALRSSERILGDCSRAYAFARPNLLFDRDGRLAEMQAAVAAEYADRGWVRRRCDDASERLRRSLRGAQIVSQFEPRPDQVLCWVYPLPAVAHAVLTADLKTPVVRACYGELRDTLLRYGCEAAYESILEAVGFRGLGHDQVTALFDACCRALADAGEVLATPFYGSRVLRPESHEIAVGAARSLLQRGSYREALFPILWLHTMCIKALATDGSAALHAQHAVAYRELLEALGIGSRTALAASAERLYDFLPQLRCESQAVLEADPSLPHHEFSQEPGPVSSAASEPDANSEFTDVCDHMRTGRG